MTSTASTSTNVLPPYFIWRRPIRPKTSSQRRARCSAMRTAPPANQGQNPPRRTRPQRSQAVAATITRKPRGARKSTAFLKRLLMGVSGPPPLALHRLVGQEEAGEDHERVESARGQELADHDLQVGQGSGGEKLDRPLPLLLREQAHGQHGGHEQRHHRHVVEDRADQVLVERQLHPSAELHPLLGSPHRLFEEEREADVEESTEQPGPDDEENVG